ncbi:MAG: hypothetical protein HY340_02010 [Candidatus Kerfeldbacteria bacterium]|nr:hypothetical protein [Candidatus Kerfeldbacteria bacterium]
MTTDTPAAAQDVLRPCPTMQTLRDYAAGVLHTPRLAIEVHVDHCHACRRTLDALTELLVERLREGV